VKLIFVHGWSVTNTNTYGELPIALSNASASSGFDLVIEHLYLAKYISFHDEVTVDDIARAMDKALRDLPGNNETTINPFSCIAHSTGGPIVRYWIDKYYGSKGLVNMPLKHLVMLAPANHGSALAVLGKSRVGRIQSWFQGIEPGQKVLDWLCLGSEGQWSLNENYLKYNSIPNNFFPFVLTGQGIDNHFYDFLNSYLVEQGSDGVVRVSGANMNTRFISLTQSIDKIVRHKPKTYELVVNGKVREAKKTAINVYKKYSHSGSKMGIMRSVKASETGSIIVADILKCLQTENVADYNNRIEEFRCFTQDQQAGAATYCMLVFNVRDDQGNQIKSGDYDLYLLAGKDYKPQQLPKGFFKDRQMNEKSNRLVYYLDADKMCEIKDGKFGLRVVARPSSGFSYYCAAEFQSDGIGTKHFLSANETTYIDIKLHRFVDKNVFRFDSAREKPVSYKGVKPSGESVS